MGITNFNLIKRRLKGKVRELVILPRKRLSFRIVKKRLTETIEMLTKINGFSHLTMITGVDIGTKIEVIYHMIFENTQALIRVRVPKKKSVLPTIVHLIPGAILYEREMHDFFGVDFQGNPDLSPLFLPEKWPDGVYPLRKDWTIKKMLKKIGRKEKM